MLSSDPALQPIDAMSIFTGTGRRLVTLGDSNDFAHIGGHVALDPLGGGLLSDILPTWIHTRAASPRTSSSAGCSIG